MLAFTHRYTALPTPLSKLETLDELQARVEAEWNEALTSDAYRQGDWDRKALLQRLAIQRMTSFRIGSRLHRDTRWLLEAVEAGEVFVLQSGGYPSRYFCRGNLVLTQLKLDVMTDLGDCLFPAALPEAADWIHIEEWDQS